MSTCTLININALAKRERVSEITASLNACAWFAAVFHHYRMLIGINLVFARMCVWL